MSQFRKVKNEWIDEITVQATLAILDKLDIETDKPTEEEVAKKFGFEESYHNGRSLHCKWRAEEILYKCLVPIYVFPEMKLLFP